jgi:quinol monooxygenase YgiN
MINVIASLKIKPNNLDSFQEQLASIVDTVRAENGCIEYLPTIDVKTGIDTQILNPDTVTIIEKWESLEALHAHRAVSHMLVFKKNTKDMLLNMSIKVLGEI